MLATFLTLVRLLSGARFFAIVAFPTFSDDEDEAFRFANEDEVDDENDERRFWVDILDKTQFRVRVQEAFFAPLASLVQPFLLLA